MKHSLKPFSLLLASMLFLGTACSPQGTDSSDNPSGTETTLSAGTTISTTDSAGSTTGSVDSTLSVTTSTAATTASKTSKSSTTTTQKPSTTTTKAPVREYYSSTVGMWYTVWWDSQERDPHYYQHHWLKETRSKPLKHGYYASDDTNKIKDDFTFFHRIGIDYLLLDDTNNHAADSGNIASHINTIFKTVKSMGVGKAPKLSFAGGSPLLNGSEDGMIAEMDIFNGYAVAYKDFTFFWKGKPLFVNFNIPKNYGWQDPKGRFTMRPAGGHTSEGLGYATKYQLNKIGMYGWVFDKQYDTSEVYGINPGWSRSHNGLSSAAPPRSRENGKVYQQHWLNAIKRKPEMIVIASWNDHAEETGIEAVELLESVEGRGQEDPYYYEKITEGYLALKTGYLEGWYYRAESDAKTYQYTNGKLKYVASVPSKAAVIVVPNDYYTWAGVPRT